MASSNIELKVGLLVIIGAAILIFGIYLAKGYSYGQDFYTASVRFPEIGTLSSGDPVSVSGVQRGKVREISLFEGDVLVEIDLFRDVVLKEDASFIVKNIGLMGERFVAVYTGKSETVLDLTHPASGRFDPGIPEVMGMMGDVIGRVNDLVVMLEKTVISPATLDKFSETVSNLHKITTRIESSTTTNAPRIDSIVGDLGIVVRQFKNGWEKNQTHIDSAANNFDKASRQLVALLDDLETTTAHLNLFATDLSESEGTLRMLMEDRRLYDDLRTTAKNLDSLVNDIRANPKKYISFSVELF